MATIAQIRPALRTVVASVSGIDRAYRRVPENPPPDSVAKFAVIKFVRGDIQPSNVTVFDHVVEVYILTRRAGDIVAEDDAVDDFVDTFTDALWTNVTLGGLVYGINFESPAYEFVTVPYTAEKTYYGPKFTLVLKTKKTPTFSG